MADKYLRWRLLGHVSTQKKILDLMGIELSTFGLKSWALTDQAKIAGGI